MPNVIWIAPGNRAIVFDDLLQEVYALMLNSLGLPHGFVESQCRSRRRKRPSKRRWKALIRLGRWVPEQALHEHRLTMPEGAEIDINSMRQRQAR